VLGGKVRIRCKLINCIVNHNYTKTAGAPYDQVMSELYKYAKVRLLIEN